MTNSSKRLSVKEKIGYSLGDVATNFFFQSMILYQTRFYTDTAGLSAVAVGSMFLLLIFGWLLVWILNVALSARDRAGAVICVGVAAMTFWHVTVNVAMVLGLAPVVGVTLPFVSYGGSSLVVFLLAMGLVGNVSLRKHGY